MMDLSMAVSHYGTLETNGISKDYHLGPEADQRSRNVVDWDDPRLARVTRLRLLTDPGFPMYDISYCHGVLKNGECCEVVFPFDQIPKRGSMRFIVAEAKLAGVYAKGLGLLDKNNISVLC